MNIALCLNKKYIPYATVTVISLMIHETEDLDIYMVHQDMDDADIKKMSASLGYARKNLTADKRRNLSAVSILPEVRLHSVKADVSELPAEAPVTNNWTAEIYFRLMFTELLPPEVDRVLYMDCDMVTVHSVSQLYHTDLGGKLLCACIDVRGDKAFEKMQPMQQKMLGPLMQKGYHYFNSGVLLFDMNVMRERHSFDDYVKALKDWDYKVVAPDQDLLNYVNYAETKVIDWKRYNFFARNAATCGITSTDIYDTDICIVHFPGPKPWNNTGDHYEAELIWWDIASLSDDYQRLLYDFMHSALTDTRLTRLVERITFQWDMISDENKKLKSQNEELQSMCRRLTEIVENLAGKS